VATTDHDAQAPAIAAVAALEDSLRRGMYGFIRAAGRPVTRDEAAASVGISRKLAAFHLDKLVDAGLLRAHFEAAGGLRKVGRRPKRYEPSEADIQVSIPQRQHDLLAGILLEAVLTEGTDETAHAAAVRVAHEQGSDMGAAERAQVRPGRLGAERALTVATRLLQRHGFEPDRHTTTSVRLRNCPFHPLAAKAPELVCRINHAFLTGMIAGLDTRAVDAILQPRNGECCVQLRAGGLPHPDA
jgi:predicted ArsR family transcriptional regulator